MNSRLLPVSNYPSNCTGYNGQNGYYVALVPGLGSFKKTFTHAGSDILDHIIAYDSAEIDGAYVGQINMITVSSFCGPEGLIWGYDVARVEHPNALFLIDHSAEFEGMQIFDGVALREAATWLFGTNKDRHFPLLPGSHVPCAGKYRFFDGPTIIYSMVAIAIPEDRQKDACLLMEDVGQLTDTNGSGEMEKMKTLLARNVALSIIEVGKNQRVSYKKVFIDICAKRIPAGEVGCALAAMPYFHIAKNAYDKKLDSITLDEWIMIKKKYFGSLK